MKLRFFQFFFAALIAAAQIPVLTPTPASLSFTFVTGGALPVAQTISIKAGASKAAYTTAIAPLGTPWITITPDTGVLPAAMSILVNPSGLAVGTYVVDIQFTAAGFATLTIPVTLTVEPAPPTLLLSVNTLSFVTPPNAPVTQTLTLSTTGGAVPFTASAGSAAWLSVLPTSGVALPGVPVTLTVAVNGAAFDPSATAYAGKITIVATGVPSNNATQTVAVAMLVNALTPTISSLYPSAALVGSAALTLTITGTGFYKGTTAIAAASPTPLKTTFVNSTTLVAVLPASALASAGPINVQAVNPAPGGDSTTVAFTVSATPVVQAVLSAASYAAGGVSPGEFVVLFGTGIGPVTPAGMSVVAGYATLALQSVSATIDGQSAAMIYVSANQITLQVPYTVTLGSGKVVTVNNNGVIMSTTVTTVATAPGFFTLTENGLGQCAALTFSMKTGTFSVNGSTSPALAGDIMVFYMTGEGIYDLTPSPATGYVVPAALSPLPQLNPLPAVTIGGAAATVQYAGPVAGGLLGLLQVNAVVPATSTIGNAVPVSITIGAGTTQVGATIVVK
ncbi:MAG TPA: IPT/TIG domain-containing protein [Bryobacteraceae bacterium]|nr:IPT/TIG domain-containing protein [Bryobacteraceae bacterium]